MDDDSTFHLTLSAFQQLHTLSINGNRIEDLEPFIAAVAVAFPSLTYLSMVNNAACPYFSLLSHHYYNFRQVLCGLAFVSVCVHTTYVYCWIHNEINRIFVVSRLPNLTYLDSTAVSRGCLAVGGIGYTIRVHVPEMRYGLCFLCAAEGRHVYRAC